MNAKPRRFSCITIAGLFLAVGLTSAALADDITDQIDEALKAYQKKDLGTASTALDLAQNLIRQLSAEAWKTMLPEPLAGWRADVAETTSASATMFGGGTTISRHYHRDGDTVEITLITDSPMMQGIGALFSSAIMTSSDMKLLVIDGRKITYTKSENSYQSMIAKKVLVKVEGGKNVEERTLRDYFTAIKLQQIETRAQ